MALLKFGQQEHIEQLQSEGLLYCNTLEYFRTLEADENRSDTDEGLAAFYQADAVRMTIGTGDGTAVQLDASTGLIGPVRISLDAHLGVNIYCMYALSRDSLYVDARNFRFGPWCLAILDSDEFRRIALAARANRIGLEARLVEYYDETVSSGESTPFKKCDRFRYQNELRFVLRPAHGKPYRFAIGSLNDISAIVPSSEINDYIHVPSSRLLAADTREP
jgi:hypothetical protein